MWDLLREAGERWSVRKQREWDDLGEQLVKNRVQECSLDAGAYYTLALYSVNKPGSRREAGNEQTTRIQDAMTSLFGGRPLASAVVFIMGKLLTPGFLVGCFFLHAAGFNLA